MHVFIPNVHNMESCVDENTFYEKLEQLKKNPQSKFTIYLDQSFYDKAKNCLQLTQSSDNNEPGARGPPCEQELSSAEITAIKRKKWTLKDGEIITADNKRVVPKNDLHKVLTQCHTSTAHRGRDKTNNYVKARYSDIPQQVVALFTSLCHLHQQQKSVTDHQKRPITNPISAETFLTHVEVDLIDFRNLKCSCEDKCHQWVIHITDHHTKYSWLFPLENKTAEEVLQKLEQLFWLFGFPHTLHTDNGKEFKNNLMKEFCAKHKIKQVHGAPRTPQTQGLVERNNRTVKENLLNILKENKADLRTWCSTLGEAAYKKNITTHRAIKESPYKLVFGIDPKKEIQVTSGHHQTQQQQQDEPQKQQTKAAATTTQPGPAKKQQQQQQQQQTPKRKAPSPAEEETRKKKRIETNTHQQNYNEKMKYARAKPTVFDIGDYVSIKIDKVDKTQLHPNVLFAQIIKIENGYAKVACKYGIISTLISPSRLVRCTATNVKIDKKKEITFSKACKLAMDQ